MVGCTVVGLHNLLLRQICNAKVNSIPLLLEKWVDAFGDGLLNGCAVALSIGGEEAKYDTTISKLRRIHQSGGAGGVM